MQVNRYLKDKRMDRIDHALGRPVNPLGETYRNYYAIDFNSWQAAEMAADPAWHIGRRFDRMIYLHVTDHGRRALRDHLRQIGDRHRTWIIEWEGMKLTEVAETRSKAMYRKWMSVSDTCDISFGDFLKSAKVLT